MAYLFDALDFPEGSMFRGVWTNSTIDPATGPELAFGQMIVLPAGQDPVVESDFISSHVALHVGGLYGVFADGQGWLFVIQKSPRYSESVVGSRHAYWAMVDGVDRAIKFNEGAELTSEMHWDDEEIQRVYVERGVASAAVKDWPIAELVWGLLAECCNVTLATIVDRKESGCAFPDDQHECQGSVFSDVFSRWVRGEIPPPALDEDTSEDAEVPEVVAADTGAGADAPEPVRLPRIVLENAWQPFGDQFQVVVTWTDDGVLHSAICDYSDRPGMGEGEDIPDCLALLQWLILDRFGSDWRRLVEYCGDEDVELDLTVEVDIPDDAPRGIVVGEADGEVYARLNRWGSDDAGQIIGWHELTLCLLRDRCEGPGARGRLHGLLAKAGIETVTRWRGYV